GEGAVTNLVNRGTVLLNYRLGDTLTIVSDACPCGRTLPLCSYLERTKAAWLKLGHGRRVHAQVLRLVLHHDRDVWRFQVVQEDERRLLVRLVTATSADGPATAARVASGLRESLPEDVSVRAEIVAHLPRDPSGKVTPIV